MSILNFLKKIKLLSFEDEFIVDPVDQISPEYGRQMGLLTAIPQEKVLVDKTVQSRQRELEEYLYEETNSLDPASLSYYDPWTHMNE